MEKLTPRAIVRELDKYIVGQEGAKKAVAIALRNRERRWSLPKEMKEEVMPKNIMLIGPSGVGKTELSRRMAALVDAPFVVVEATKFTEVGYVGRDVESIIHDLVDTSVSRVYENKLKEVEGQAEKMANAKILHYLYQQRTLKKKKLVAKGRSGVATSGKTSPQRAAAATAEVGAGMAKRYLARLLSSNKLEEEMIEIEVSYPMESPFIDYRVGYCYGEDMNDAPGDVAEGGKNYGPPRRRRKVTVREARRILVRQEANKLMDFDQLSEEAIKRAENHGVVFVDEVDKLASPTVDIGRDISGEGVQRDLLPIIEGTTVMTRCGLIKTDHILFIGAGTFYKNKPSDLIPELQGRFPLRVELSALTQGDLEKILVEPQNSLCKQYRALMATEGVELTFAPDGIKEMARLAALMNERLENIGARRLHTIMEKVLEELNFTAGEREGEKVVVDAAYVSDHIGDLIKNEDLSRYIL